MQVQGRFRETPLNAINHDKHTQSRSPVDPHNAEKSAWIISKDVFRKIPHHDRHKREELRKREDSRCRLKGFEPVATSPPSQGFPDNSIVLTAKLLRLRKILKSISSMIHAIKKYQDKQKMNERMIIHVTIF